MKGPEQTPGTASFEPSTRHSISQTRRNLIAILLLLLATAAAMAALFQLAARAPGVEADSVMSITGIPTCLPHKDTTSPTTLECALGIKGDDNRYYALQDAPASLLQEDFGLPVVIKGTLALPHADEKYAIAGTITVQSATRQ